MFGCVVFLIFLSEMANATLREQDVQDLRMYRMLLVICL